MASHPTDETGRFVWVVTWGRPGRVDWKAVLVKAHDGEEAERVAREERPDLFPPDGVVLAAPAVARAVLEGRGGDDAAVAPVAHLPLLG